MGNQEDQNFTFIAVLLAYGILSAVGILFAGSLFFQRKQADSFFASDDYRVFQERVAVTNIRRQIAEDFVGAVVSCISPPISTGQTLTEQQITESVTAAIEKTSLSNANAENAKCQHSKSSHWTFELPCTLKISESFSKLNGLHLGNIGLCMAPLARNILSATQICTSSDDFNACLLRSILANDYVKNEVEKPVEIQQINNK
jgi:hypothetical protein